MYQVKLPLEKILENLFVNYIHIILHGLQKTRLKCRICEGVMKMVSMVIDHKNIQVTLKAAGLPIRAPPIAPARPQ